MNNLLNAIITVLFAILSLLFMLIAIVILIVLYIWNLIVNAFFVFWLYVTEFQFKCTTNNIKKKYIKGIISEADKTQMINKELEEFERRIDEQSKLKDQLSFLLQITKNNEDRIKEN